VAVAGPTRVSYALLDPDPAPCARDRIDRWLGTALGDLIGVYGRLPNAGIQVLVVPVKAAGPSPVPFGHVIRNGGESVRFFVDPGRTLDELLADWTATHEFAHLMLPYVEERWISEGFAGYYQNVLLARRGVYDERELWSRFERSFRRAGALADPPSPNDAQARSFWEVRMLIYWSGAAVALLADARLRELSAGRETLDTVLGRLADCCLPSRRVWTGLQLFAELDRLSSHPVFVDLYRAHADSRGMPDLTALYSELGVVVTPAGIEFDRFARQAWIRREIAGVESPPESPSGYVRGR
jgi:hypothetical protein